MANNILKKKMAEDLATSFLEVFEVGLDCVQKAGDHRAELLAVLFKEVQLKPKKFYESIYSYLFVRRKKNNINKVNIDEFGDI